jgi:hypothetical protein
MTPVLQPTPTSTALSLSTSQSLSKRLQEARDVLASCQVLVRNLESLTAQYRSLDQSQISSITPDELASNTDAILPDPTEQGNFGVLTTQEHSPSPNMANLRPDEQQKIINFRDNEKQQKVGANDEPRAKKFRQKFLNAFIPRSGTRRLEPVGFSEKSRRASLAAKADQNAPSRLKRLQTVRMAGTFRTDGDIMKIIAKLTKEPLLTKKLVRLSEVTVDVLKKMDNETLSFFISPFLTGDDFLLYIKNGEGIETSVDAGTANLEKISTYTSDKKEKSTVTFKASQLAKTSGAAALAVFCLQQENEEDLFARIVAVSPAQIMQKICDLPLNGNLLSTKSMVALFARLATEDPKLIYIQPKSLELDAVVGLGLALRHYFRFSPVSGLVSHLPKPLMLARQGSEKNDLLFQDQHKFFYEVKLLARELTVNAGDLPVDDDIKNKVCGRQLALLVGNTFGYGAEFLAELQGDRKKVSAKIGTAVDFFKIGLGAGAAAGGAPGPAMEAIGKGETVMGNKLSELATRPGDEFDIPALHRNLGFYAEEITNQAKDGMLIAGENAMQPEAFLALAPGSQTRRQKLGKKLSEVYEQQLKMFESFYLENKLPEIT